MKSKTGTPRKKHYPNLNKELDHAIDSQFLPRYKIAQAADMSATKLNKIVFGEAPALPIEQTAIAKALGLRIKDIFKIK